MSEPDFARPELKTSSLGEGSAFAVICTHYDAKAYNACREPAADRVVDKERANFCDFFTPFAGQHDMDAKADDARAKLEALFKKS